MSTMVCLVGDQPIPNLLPIKYLNPDHVLLVTTKKTEEVARRIRVLLPNTKAQSVHPYDLLATVSALEREIAGQTDLVFNLTGGTKMMALAAYSLAARSGHPFVYLQSEGRQSILLRYHFKDGLPFLESKDIIPKVISAMDYLKAHRLGFHEEGPHCENGKITDGGLFEQTLAGVLRQKGFDEVLIGVRDRSVADQIEIDLVILLDNQVGVAEVKLGDAAGEGAKRGLDQLAMAGSPEYLGTYTARFLITARVVPPTIHTLARERDISIIELPSYQTHGPLSQKDAQRLADRVRERLCAAPRGYGAR
ncbi:MAG: hypothetical protein ACUVX9_00670 [Anaerolineae bacterium]